MNWHLLTTCVVGAGLQWLAMNFARRVGFRRGYEKGCGHGFEAGSTMALRIMQRLSDAATADELRAKRDEMLAELEALKH